ncbi:MAG: type II secretion system protein [Myxococcales bacterium]|nr:type II secretion system protein [Myxococcales bacterium]MCB9628035.1 type II secretion system protein [Sandaracinaceae bacterium]
MTRRDARAGFTLLEVMVAVAILALSLTAIFSSQVGAMRTAARSRSISTASLLARCKMGEIEEQIANEGLPAIDDHGRDECCEGAEMRGFRCEWRIDRVVLPGETGGGEGGEESGLPGMGDDEGPALAMGDFLGGGSDTSGLAEMAIGLAYPVLKPHIEEQVRRVTVEVFWTEGETERSFDVLQYVVGEQPPAAPDPDSVPTP